MRSRPSGRATSLGSPRRSSRSRDPLAEAARLEALGDLPGALDCLRAARGSRHDGWPLRHSMGQLRARLGDPQGAVLELEQALAVRPDAIPTLEGLAAAQAELGRSEAARTALGRVLELDPARAQAHVELAVLAASEGELEPALHHVRAAIERDPAHADAHASLGRILGRMDAHAEAIAAFDRACACAPHDPMIAMDAALARIAAGAEADAEAFLATALARHPGHAGLLAARALALGGLGREADVRRLHGLHRFVKTRRLDVDPRAFLPALLEDPTLTESPRRHATRRGLHSGALDHRRHPALAALYDAIAAALQQYLRELPGIVHPFVSARPRELGLQLWSVVLHEGGHQVPHIHPEAWVSGVFYVEVPDVEAALAKAEALGGTRLMGPDNVMPGLVIGQFTDPEGHLVGVMHND